MYQPTIDATTWTLLAPSPTSPSPFTVRGSHVIVLTHTQPGAGRLGAPDGLLTGHPSLACTAGSGVLQLCEQAASTWRRAERTGSTLSTLAAASVRAMTGSLISVIKSHEARDRWCEISPAPTRAARTFLEIYPETKVVCLHRHCADVVQAVLLNDRESPDREMQDREMRGERLAAAVAQWQARTESLLALERDHAGQCLRVRYEDLVTRPAAAAGLLSFLGLDRQSDLDWRPHTPPGAPQTAALVAGRIGSEQLGQINQLHAELRYPALGRVRTGGG